MTQFDPRVLADLAQNNPAYAGFRGANSQAGENPLLAGSTLPETNQWSKILPNHPRLSQGLDNATLMMGMIPGADTVGGNISQVAQAFNNLPYAKLMRAYQMFQPGNEMSELQSKIGLQNAQADSERAQGDYYRQIGGMYAGQNAADVRIAEINAASKPEFDTTEQVDDNGKQWKFNLKTKQLEPSLGPGSVGPDYVPTFKNLERRRSSAFGSLEERLLSGELTTNINSYRAEQGLPPIKQEDAVKIVAQMRGSFAGATAGAGAAATQPFKDVTDFINNEEAGKYAGIDKELDPVKDALDYKIFSTLQSIENPDAPAVPLETRNTGIAQKKKETDRLFGLWRNSSAPRNGISFKAWQESLANAPQISPGRPTSGARDLGAAPRGAKEGDTGQFNGVPGIVRGGRIVAR